MESIRKAAADRVLSDMLGSIKDNTGGGWKVLILDELTTKVISSLVKMSDITECNVSVVEDLQKARQPLPLAAVYFISPTPGSVMRLLQDFAGKPLYPSVHIYFSSKLSTNQLDGIKQCASLMGVIKTLKESNLEFTIVDSRTAVTDNPAATMLLLGDQADSAGRECEKELEGIALRLTTMLAALNEFPAVRYRKGKAPETTDPPGAAARATLTQRLAQKVCARVDVLQQTGSLPGRETCDLLILDRTYDAVVPFIHEWTYECLVHDLLPVDGKTYKYTAESADGKAERREATLDDNDPLWCELRHVFIADVYATLGERFKEFQSRNKVAASRLGGKQGGSDQMSGGAIRALITALPQYREVLNKLYAHITISSDLRAVTNQHALTDVGELEQDLVLGEKTSKEMLAFINDTQQVMTVPDKLRLLCCYAATHPEKLDMEKLNVWQRAARLAPHDMVTVTNLALLGVPVMKNERAERSGSSFFGGGGRKRTQDFTRTKKVDDQGYALNRFEPLLKLILNDLVAGKLREDAFPYVRPPGADVGADAAAAAQSARTGRGGSMINWTRRGGAGEGSGSAGARRVLVFIIGGAFRSEMRVVHEMAKATGRDMVLGSTSVETPVSFLNHLVRMNSSGVVYGAQ